MECLCDKMVIKRNNIFDVYFSLCNFLGRSRTSVSEFQSRNFERFYSMIKTHPRLYIYIKVFKRSAPFVEATLTSASCIR